MTECEKLATQFGFSSVILSTHDKKEFYQKLGYEFCQPVYQYGAPPSVESHLVSLIYLKLPRASMTIIFVFKVERSQNNKASEPISEITPCYESDFKTKASLPQPPPLPQFTSTLSTKKDYMKKYLK